MRRTGTLLIALGALAVLVAALPAARALLGDDTDALGAERAAPAAAFVDSVGVNIHANFLDTAYAQGDRVVATVRDLGVRHVRDGTEPGVPQAVALHQRLAAQGVRTTFIVGDAVTPMAPRIAALAGPLRSGIAALEGANELDRFDAPGWLPRLRSHARELDAAVRATPALAGLPLIAPSLSRPERRDDVGALPAGFDLGNAHPYAGGRPPEAVSDELLGLGERRPVVVTESGYHTAPQATVNQPGVTERAQALYVPRLFLEHFRRGVPRTFLYELLDEKPDPSFADPEQHFGLVRQDFTPKPAFGALRTLLALARPFARAAPERLPARLEGEVDEVRSLVLQRGPDGWLLALWHPAPVFDLASRADVEPARVPVTVRFERPLATAVHLPTAGPGPVRRAGPARELALELGGEAVLVHVGATGPTP